MARRTRRLLAGAALLALVVPASAGAADPSVTVRVEGTADTLVPRASVPLTATAVVRDGHSCPGDSAVAALDRATSGGWGGTWNAGFSDWELSAIKGETHSFAASAYWGFFLNEAAASLGVCGQKLQAGDRVLFAPAPSNGDAIGVLSLDGVPARAVPGVPFTVTVKRTATSFPPPDYAPLTETLPVAGATIALPGGGHGDHRRRRDRGDHADRRRSGGAPRRAGGRRAVGRRAGVRDVGRRRALRLDDARTGVGVARRR